MEDVKFILAKDYIVESFAIRKFNKLFEKQKNEIEYKLKIDFDLKDDKVQFLKDTLKKLKEDILNEIDGDYQFKKLKKNITIDINDSKITVNDVFFTDYLYSFDLNFYLSPKHYEHNNKNTYEIYKMYDSWNIQYHNQIQNDIKERDVCLKNAQMDYVPIAYRKRKKDKDKYDIIITDTSIIAIPFKDLDFDDLEKYFEANGINFKYIIDFSLYFYFTKEYNNLLSSDDLLELETGEKPNLKLSRQIIIFNELGIIEYLKNKHKDIRPVSREIAKLLDDATEDSINSYITGILSNYKTAHNPYKSQKNKELVKELKELFKKYSL